MTYGEKNLIFLMPRRKTNENYFYAEKVAMADLV